MSKINFRNINFSMKSWLRSACLSCLRIYYTPPPPTMLRLCGNYNTKYMPLMKKPKFVAIFCSLKNASPVPLPPHPMIIVTSMIPSPLRMSGSVGNFMGRNLVVTALYILSLGNWTFFSYFLEHQPLFHICPQTTRLLVHTSQIQVLLTPSFPFSWPEMNISNFVFSTCYFQPTCKLSVQHSPHSTLNLGSNFL